MDGRFYEFYLDGEMAADTCLDVGSGGLEVQAPPAAPPQTRARRAGRARVGEAPSPRSPPGSGRLGRPGRQGAGGRVRLEAAGRAEGVAGMPLDVRNPRSRVRAERAGPGPFVWRGRRAGAVGGPALRARGRPSGPEPGAGAGGGGPGCGPAPRASRPQLDRPSARPTARGTGPGIKAGGAGNKARRAAS